jgi:energy-coupling factor transporter ATP-binding protein EcfA2
MYLSRVKLKDVRCFREVDLCFGTPDQPRLWTVVIGDNGAGKSTLLRAIAIGLCGLQSASALLSELSGDFIRRNKQGRPQPSATIELTLTPGDSRPPFTITTTVKRDVFGQEIVTKETDPRDFDPGNEIFVCGYGANRGTCGIAVRDRYSFRDGVLSLFNDHTTLLHLESVLRDLKLRDLEPADEGNPDLPFFDETIGHLKSILGLKPNHQLEVTSRGVIVHGPWGEMPFHALGDGYRGTAGWILDLIGMALIAERLAPREKFEALVLIDEVDEHLHPRWQKIIIPRLKQRFPRVQFVATTHSPLTLVNTGPEEVVVTTLRNAIAEIHGPLPDPVGKTVNEILQGDWFGLSSILDETSEELLKKYRRALQKPDVPADELEQMRAQLRERIGSFVTSPLDELALEIANEACQQWKNAASEEERKALIQQSAAQLRARLKEGTAHDLAHGPTPSGTC